MDFGKGALKAGNHMGQIAIQNEAVKKLESEILKLPQVDLRTEHVLSGGVYARTIHIPAGTILTGATHKKDHVNVVIGDIAVTTDDGTKRLTGYHVFASKAGAKRAGVAISDTAWTTICKTDLTDIEAIEDELVEESECLQTRLIALPGAEFTELEN
jgi:hypothetical protein